MIPPRPPRSVGHSEPLICCQGSLACILLTRPASDSPAGLPRSCRVPIAPWLRERLEAEGLRTVAAAPVRLGGAIRGALGFLDGPGRSFDDEGLRGIARLAEQLASDLARAAP